MDEGVARLLDERDIVALAVRYCWCLDTGDGEGLRDVFTPDAHASLGTDCHGIDAIVERVTSALAPLDASQHMVNTHDVRIDGDTATARCYFHAQHVLRGREGGDSFIVAGIYHDRLVRTDAGWRIVRRVLETLWTEGNQRVVRPDRH
ncbi:MAG: nuclear transport factor 2 family protein [Acidimicrobiia bacterium]|nr:nuclear transport factor 2 family protein [Acidimicrobiia bacterium]